MAEVKNEGRAIAKARDMFFRDNTNLLNGEASGQYLKNRLEKAFIAGWDAHQPTACKRHKKV